MVYEIRVRGQLDESWSDWLGKVRIAASEEADGTWTTILVGEVPDQPALFGILDRIRDLNLCLLSVRQIDERAP